MIWRWNIAVPVRAEKLTGINVEYDDINVFEEENEAEFDKIIEAAGTDHVPCVLIDNFVLAPGVNFHSIDEAIQIVSQIIKDKEVG